MLSNSGWRAASASLMNFAPGPTASPAWVSSRKLKETGM